MKKEAYKIQAYIQQKRDLLRDLIPNPRSLADFAGEASQTKAIVSLDLKISESNKAMDGLRDKLKAARNVI